MLNFDFSGKGLGLASLPHFEYDVPTKIFLMLYFAVTLHSIVWLPLLFEILRNMCIAIIYLKVCDTIT